jgi:hypothetical protein
MEAMRAMLVHNGGKDNEAFVNTTASQLLTRARGSDAHSAYPLDGELGRPAERLRDALVARLKDGVPDPEDLGVNIEVARQMTWAGAILPASGRDTKERIQVWTSVARRLLALDGVRPGGELEFAQSLVEACAKAAGLRRPSRLFDRERKALKRG